MKKQILTLTYFVLLTSNAFSQVDSSEIGIDAPNLNYKVDKFEHLVFGEASLGVIDIWIAGGYEFVYNFHERFRLVSGLGFGYGKESYAFSPRTSIQMGKKLTRFEFGFYSQIMSQKRFESLYSQQGSLIIYNGNRIYRKVLFQIGPTLGIRFRHFRNVEAGVSWRPLWTVGAKPIDNYLNMMNFTGQIRIFINSSKRRKELGKWRGVHPFRGVNYREEIKKATEIKRSEIRAKKEALKN